MTAERSITPEMEVVVAAGSILGEAPLWAGDEQALYWADIKACLLHRLDVRSGDVRTWRLPNEVGSFALRACGGVVVALRTGLAFLDLDSGEVTPMADPEADRPANRFNDGKCDRRGRFWAGTLHDDEAAPLGALYRLDPDGACHMMRTGVICSNGLGWSPDDRTMYFTDSGTYRIFAYDFDLDTGEIEGERVFVEDDPAGGGPDGLTVDAEGGVWSAKWDGWRVVRHTPDGTVDQVVELPVQRPTSCTFGGSRLDRLYVTSASIGLGPAELAAGPLAGALFVTDVGVTGLAEPRFAG